MEAFFDVAVLEKERRVMAVENAHGLVQVSIPAGTHTFDRLVACAGLQSDVVAKPVGARPSPAAVAVAGSIQHPVPAGAVREGCARLRPAAPCEQRKVGTDACLE